MPIWGCRILLEVGIDFGEEAVVKLWVFLELDFAEVDEGIGVGAFGDEEAIDAEGGLLDFNRAEVIVDDRVSTLA